MGEIRKKVSSGNAEVLKQSLEFAKQRLSMEAERGKAAEARATGILAVLGLMSGLLIQIAAPIANMGGNDRALLYALFAATLGFLVKGILYAMKVLGVGKRLRLEIETVYEFQALSSLEAIREEIVATVWEFKSQIGPNNKKLFWLHRCQRNGAICILFLVILGAALAARTEQWVSVSSVWNWIGAVVVAILLVSVDALAERYGIWGNE